MPEQYELSQNKAGNDTPRTSGVDFLAGWPGLSRTPVRPATTTDTPPAPAPNPVTVTRPVDTSTAGAGGTSMNWRYPGRITHTPGQIDYLRGWNGLDSSTPVAAPIDRTPKYPVKNGVLEINFNDLTRLSELPATDGPYNTLKIGKVPSGTQILHWADQSGYYFFFQGAGGNNIYHYPRSLRIIDMDGQRFDIDRSRLKVNEYALAQAAQAEDPSKNPFSSISNPRVDAVTYFKRMAATSAQSLKWQEDILRQGVKDSTNPYFQIYLADVLTMEAMQPLVRGALAGQVTVEQKQQILNKLDEALAQLKTAADMSYNPLYQMNRFPQGNVVMPLAPEAFFFTPPPGSRYDPYYSYWGGAWDQANRRRAAITFMRGFVESDAYKLFELPPELPPGGQVYR